MRTWASSAYRPLSCARPQRVEHAIGMFLSVAPTIAGSADKCAEWAGCAVEHHAERGLLEAVSPAAFEVRGAREGVHPLEPSEAFTGGNNVETAQLPARLRSIRSEGVRGATRDERCFRSPWKSFGRARAGCTPRARANLELLQGEYRLEKPSFGMVFYRITLPIRGTYPQIGNSSAPRSRTCRSHRSTRCGSSARKRRYAARSQVRMTVYFRPANEGETP